MDLTERMGRSVRMLNSDMAKAGNLGEDFQSRVEAIRLQVNDLARSRKGEGSPTRSRVRSKIVEGEIMYTVHWDEHYLEFTINPPDGLVDYRSEREDAEVESEEGLSFNDAEKKVSEFKGRAQTEFQRAGGGLNARSPRGARDLLGRDAADEHPSPPKPSPA